MHNITTLLFDFDNTLSDRQRAAKRLLKEFIQEDFPSEHYDDAYRHSVFLRLYELDGEGHASKETVYTQYIQEFHIAKKDWQWYNTEWNKRMGQYTVLFPTTHHVLKSLQKNYRLGLLTNGNSQGQRLKLQTAGIDSYFEKIVISGDYKIHKPDPRIFHILLKEMQVTPSECVYIGDGLNNDIQGAIQTGMQAIWVYPYPEKDTNYPCQRIYRIEDLLYCL